MATFPNVTVNTGDEYKTCVLPLKTLKISCAEGTNSLAKRPEVVDLSLNSIDKVLKLDTTQISLTLSSPEDDHNSASDNDREKKDKKGDR